MKIYTKTGDKGETSIGSGKRVAKDSARITAYGESDELNAVLGVCRGLITNYKLRITNGEGVISDKLQARSDGGILVGQNGGHIFADAKMDFLEEILIQLQKDLWMVGSDLASPQNAKVGGKVVPRVSGADTERLEQWIDRIDAAVPPLTSFIMPGGCMLSAQLHLARTVCRRTERALITLAREEEVAEEIVMYMNRLSDLLFMMARYANVQAGYEEEKVG